jgi:hypothetical protein
MKHFRVAYIVRLWPGGSQQRTDIVQAEHEEAARLEIMKRGGAILSVIEVKK